MKQIHFEVSDGFHKAIKKACAERGVTITHAARQLFLALVNGGIDALLEADAYAEPHKALAAANFVKTTLQGLSDP